MSDDFETYTNQTSWVLHELEQRLDELTNKLVQQDETIATQQVAITRLTEQVLDLISKTRGYC